MLPRNDLDRIKSPLMTTAWWPMQSCSYPPPWPDASACPNWYRSTWTWAMRRANTGDKVMTRVASALDAATALTMPTCCALGERPHPGRHGQGAIHPGRLPAPEESPLGSAQGHHRHGPQAGPHHLRHAAVRPSVRGCRRRVLQPVSSKGAPLHQAACRPAGLPTGPHSRYPSSSCAPRISGRGGVKVFVGP